MRHQAAGVGFGSTRGGPRYVLEALCVVRIERVFTSHVVDRACLRKVRRVGPAALVEVCLALELADGADGAGDERKSDTQLCRDMRGLTGLRL